MKTIVLLDRIAGNLLPLTANAPLALLPVAGKPLVDYTLELLVEAGIRDALVVTGPFSKEISLHLGYGERWGLRLDYAFSTGDVDVPTLVERVSEDSEDELLVVRGDMLRAMSLEAFLTAARSGTHDLRHAAADGHSLGVSYSRACHKGLRALNPGSLSHSHAEDFMVMEGVGYALETLKEFHRANLEISSGRVSGFRRNGREVALGLRVGRHSSMAPKSLEVGTAQIGNHCHIDPSVSIRGDVVIADNVIIDRKVHIENAVIMANSYVGEHVTIKDAIVFGNQLIDIETGASVHIVDAFLLTHLRKVSLTTSISKVMQWWVGILIFILTLPLWPIALLISCVGKPGKPLRSKKLRGNRFHATASGRTERREFKVYEWNTRIRWLSKLPWILPVVTGDLMLIGVEPVSSEIATNRQAEWERLADLAPAGLIGPTQLFIPDRAPAEERLMSDAFYAGQSGPFKEWRILARACLAIFEPQRWILPLQIEE